MLRHHQLLLYTIASLILAAIPVISWPFNWVETYFHEVSHGLVASLTGGEIKEIVIRLNGSGHCLFTGGSVGITAFSGYFGATIAGAAMYLSARVLKMNAAILSGILIVIVTTTAFLYARDIITIIILGILIGVFYMAYSESFSAYFNKAEEFIGIYVLVSAIRAPFNLFDGQNAGDGAKLSDLTLIPEIIWIFLWGAIGFGVLIGLWIYESKNSKQIYTA